MRRKAPHKLDLGSLSLPERSTGIDYGLHRQLAAVETHYHAVLLKQSLGEACRHLACEALAFCVHRRFDRHADSDVLAHGQHVMFGLRRHRIWFTASGL